jgi:hypothetical protein
MPRNQPFDYLTARDTFAEIRATPGWSCRHGFHEGKLGIWLARTAVPTVRPLFISSRDQWLWARDMVEAAGESQEPAQAPLPIVQTARDAEGQSVVRKVSARELVAQRDKDHA